MVVDASVSLKWVLDDEDAVAEAVALRDSAINGRFEMVAPALWLYEVTNGLVTAVRRGRIDADLGAQALQHLQFVGVRLVDPDVADTYARAIRYGVAAYDAVYLALADALDVPLWTGDRRFYDQVHGVATNVQWIGTYREAG